MVPINEATYIADLFYLLDTHIRNNLYLNKIIDERDCVSKLLSLIDSPAGIVSKSFFDRIKLKTHWISNVANQKREKKFGCDGIIIFKYYGMIKIGLFEAKWPRIHDNHYRWDKRQRNTKKSHFSHQIQQQAKWSNTCAIWEMFFDEGCIGIDNLPFDKNGSTCIRHKHAYNYMQNIGANHIWNNADLINLIKYAQAQPSFNSFNDTNFKKTIYDILVCYHGKAIDINSNQQSIIVTSNDNEEKIEVPFLFNDTDRGISIIKDFLSSTNLSFFQQIDIQEVL